MERPASWHLPINTYMKVVNLELYRAKKEIELLEKKINEVATSRELKLCFKQWLQKKNGTGRSN